MKTVSPRMKIGDVASSAAQTSSAELPARTFRRANAAVHGAKIQPRRRIRRARAELLEVRLRPPLGRHPELGDARDELGRRAEPPPEAGS